MADEVVTTELKADSKSFVDAFNKATFAVSNTINVAEGMVKAYHGVASQIQKFAGAIASDFRKMAVTGATALAGMGGAALAARKNFMNFETAMANVATVTDHAHVSMGKMKDAVMNMTGDFPQSAEELANGLYEINSAGFQGADALKMLGAVAKFSVAGLVDMGTSVRATASIINAYGMEAGDAVHVTDILFKAVEEGQMTASEFAINIGDWSAAAAQMGVSFESAAAAMAVMTTEGALSANAAATSMAGIMRAFTKPSLEMTKALKRMGYDTGQAAIKSEGFAQVLGSLWEASGHSMERFNELFQDMEGYKGALGLVTAGYTSLVSAQNRFNDSSQTVNTTQRAFQLQMDTLENQTALFKNELRQMGYEMGKIVAPAFRAVVSAGTSFLGFMNDLPAPIRSFVAVLGLVSPAVVVAGGAIGMMVLKTKLFQFAIKTMLSSRILSAFPTLTAHLTKMGKAGGFLSYLSMQTRMFLKASAPMRASMLRTAAAAGAWVGAFAIAATALYSLYSAMGEAKQKAAELRASFEDVSKGGITSLSQLNDEFERTLRTYDDAQSRSGGNSFLNNMLASLQMITPFTENTKYNAKVEADALAGLADEYQQFYQVSDLMATRSGEGIDSVIASLSKLQQDGSISIDQLISTYLKYVELVKNKDVIKYTQDQALIDAIAMGTGETPKKLDPLDYMNPEIAAEWERVNGVLGTTSEEIKKTAIEQEKLDTANAAGSVSAIDFELALIKIGDAASTTADKLDAYKAIIDHLMGAPMDLRDQQADLMKSMEDLGRVMIDEGANFDVATEGGRNLQSALSTAGDAARTLMATTLEQTGSQSEATAVGASYVAGLVALAQNAGWSNDQIANMIQTMGLTPAVLETLVKLPGADPAITQLLIARGLLNNLNGFVAQAGVQVTIGVNTVTGNLGNRSAGGMPGSSGSGDSLYGVKAVNKTINDMIHGIVGNISPGKKSGGGGGGGGGGGSAKWTPTAAQLANMKKALAAPLTNLLTGELGDAWQKQMISNWVDATNRNIMAEGKTRVGARILQEAQKSGSDPSSEFDDLFAAYKELEKVTDKATADAAMNMFDTLEQFKEYVDGVVELIKHQQDIEDWKYSRSEINYTDYAEILKKRLADEQEYSDAWMSIQDQLASVEDDRLREEKRMMEARLTLEDITKEQYLTYLYQRLNAYQQYSQEWMDIWNEIHDAEQAAIDEQDNKVQAIKDFAAEVKQAFDDIKKSVSDPMLSATSLVANFGDQASISKDQLEGYYAHMMEGTQRWVTAIKALKAQGINAAFLNELISAGPQSVGFAESVLALGADGISFINQSMGDIANLANGLGTDIAQGSVGPVTNIDNTLSIQVGDITITGEMPGGVTIEEVTHAIEDALANVATGVANRQPRVDPMPRPPRRPAPVG